MYPDDDPANFASRESRFNFSCSKIIAAAVCDTDSRAPDAVADVWPRYARGGGTRPGMTCPARLRDLC